MISQQDAQNLANNLNAAGHSVNTSDVMPTTAETPLKTPDLEQLGAHFVGVFNELNGTAPTTKTANSASFLALLKQKLFKRKQPDEKVIVK